MSSQDLSCVEPFFFRRFRDYSGIIADSDERLEDGAEVCALCS